MVNGEGAEILLDKSNLPFLCLMGEKGGGVGLAGPLSSRRLK